MPAEDMQKTREQLIEELDALRARVASLELAQAAFDASNARIAVLDRSGKIVRANQTWQKHAPVGLVPECQVSEGADYLAVCEADIGEEGKPPGRFSAGIREVIRGEADRFKMEYRCCVSSERRWFAGHVIRLPDIEPPHVIVAYLDITEQKLVEEELRESQKRLAIALEAARMGTWVWDSRVPEQTFWDGESEQTLGLEPGTLTGTLDNVFSLVHPEDRDPLWAAGSEMLSGDANMDVEFRIVVKDGSIHHLATRAVKVHVEESTAVRILGVTWDITERRRAQEALEKSERNYRQLVELAQEGIWVLDAESCTTYANPRMADILGCTTDEMLGRHLFSFMADREIPAARENFQRRLQGVRDPYDFEFRRSNDESVYMSLEIGPILDDAGRYVGALALAADVTQRRQMEEALRETGERLEDRVRERTAELVEANRALQREIKQRQEALAELQVRDAAIAASINGMCFFDAGERSFYSNEAFRKLLGFPTAQSAQGIHWRDLCLEPEASDRVESEFEAIGSFVGELKGRRCDGSSFDAHVCATQIVDEQGQTTCVLCCILDVTEIKQAQESLRQSTQLRMEAEKLAATGRLAAQIAHEINNPLAGITNAMRLFRDAIPQDAPEFGYLERTEREVLRVGRIVRQMYDLHRPNQEREALTRIDEVIEEVASMLESLSRQYEVRIEVEHPLPRVRALMPEGALRQILFGLLANAIEASALGGLVRVGMAVKEELLIVSISDHGHGIPQELRHQIFEPFFSTKTGMGTEGGLGLGLPLAKRLAEAMGGDVSYESKVGGGTVFHIHLPLGGIEGVVV